jgi:hypothetical protein
MLLHCPVLSSEILFKQFYLSGTVGLESSQHGLRSFQKEFSDFDGTEVVIALVHRDLDDVIQTLRETTVHLTQFFHVEEDRGELKHILLNFNFNVYLLN